MRAVSSLVAFAALVLLPGCFEISQRVTLNPDGSGKVTQTVVTAFGPGMLEGFGQALGQGGEGGEAPDSDALAEGFKMGFSSAMTEQSEGIEAWTAPEMEALKDGRTRMTITGYFRDISKVRLSTEMNIGGGTEGDGTSEAGEERSRPDPLLSVRRTDDGRMVIDFVRRPDEADPDGEAEGEAAPELSDEELEAKIREERQSWQFAKGFMAGMIGGMKIQTSVEAPGTIESAVNVERAGGNVGSITITGQQILAVMEKIIMDDELAAKALRGGGEIMDSLEGLESDEEMLRFLFEDGRPPSMTVKLQDQPLFDYEAEVKKAREAAAEAEAADDDAEGEDDDAGAGEEKAPVRRNVTAAVPAR